MAFFMSNNKTDKELVWEAIKAIELETLNTITSSFKILVEVEWKDWTNEDKLRIRGLLLTNGLIHLMSGSPWAFQLTAAGMTLKKNDLKHNGILKPKKSYKQFWLGVIAALIGAVISTGLSAILEVWKARNLPQPQAKTVVLPKIQIVHDTIWARKTLPKKP